MLGPRGKTWGGAVGAACPTGCPQQGWPVCVAPLQKLRTAGGLLGTSLWAGDDQVTTCTQG